ncbi:MAG: CBS domain-containing protein [Ghiorsea sp.]|nr:CBS domain-containing protein [Ghiorsea sp.]
MIVTNDEGEMVGMVTFFDLQKWLLDSSLDQVVVAEEVANKNVISLSENDSLLDAIDILDRATFEQMPVTDADNPRRVLGIVSRNAVFSTYHKLIVKHGEDHAAKS